MDELITALQIFRKYVNHKYPTCCEHDTLYILCDPKMVTPADIETLKTLGFEPEQDGFYSFRFGSA